MKWFQARGQQSDVAVSTRIRLARNVKGLSFGSRLQSAQAEKLIEEVKEAAAKGATAFSLIRVDEITPEERMALYEKHLISREMMDKKPAALLLSEDESISVMINEEDHLRIQVMSAGIALKECLEEAMKLDALLQQLRGRLQGRPWVTVTWFVADEKKAGGNCVTTTGQAMKLREQPPTLLLSEGEEIPLERMLALELIENPG